MCFIRLFYRSIRVAIRGSIVQIPDQCLVFNVLCALQGFFCHSEEDFDDLCLQIHKVCFFFKKNLFVCSEESGQRGLAYSSKVICKEYSWFYRGQADVFCTKMTSSFLGSISIPDTGDPCLSQQLSDHLTGRHQKYRRDLVTN